MKPIIIGEIGDSFRVYRVKVTEEQGDQSESRSFTIIDYDRNMDSLTLLKLIYYGIRPHLELEK